VLPEANWDVSTYLQSRAVWRCGEINFLDIVPRGEQDFSGDEVSGEGAASSAPTAFPRSGSSGGLKCSAKFPSDSH
jgi:hypothetical protein